MGPLAADDMSGRYNHNDQARSCLKCILHLHVVSAMSSNVTHIHVEMACWRGERHIFCILSVTHRYWLMENKWRRNWKKNMSTLNGTAWGRSWSIIQQEIPRQFFDAALNRMIYSESFVWMWIVFTDYVLRMTISIFMTFIIQIAEWFISFAFTSTAPPAFIPEIFHKIKCYRYLSSVFS